MDNNSIASSPGSKHIACSLYSGVVLLFDTELLLNEKPCAQIKWRSPRKKKLQGAQAKEMRVVTQKTYKFLYPTLFDTELLLNEKPCAQIKWRSPRKKKLQGAQAKEMRVVSQKISEVLDINRMRPLLKQFGEYPAKFRPLVWKTLLKIPHNTEAYKILASKPEHLAFKHLDKKYPLHNKCLLNALKRLLSCLANWNPLFSLVTYLPEFVFPFVVLLRNEPCALFEVIASIIGRLTNSVINGCKL
ncbi:TBC1 domain family member 31 [Diaphorina citri]|uniref:TBC1 domain family member 31 n=1 Tax=Diaphorina citri TaxID=121845 RepID=A0A1S3D6L3_DIACI|nr:TBC1 domain family member 31 [Diaphorina citri]